MDRTKQPKIPSPSPPQVSAGLADLELSTPLETELSVTGRRVTGVAMGSAANSRWDDCLLDRARLSGADWTGAHWEDLRFQGCDLANLQGVRLYAVRVAIADSRLLGLQSTESDWKDAVFIRCAVSMANFSGSKFERVHFTDCDVGEADFTGCDLRTAVFRNCNLSRADFTGAKLNGSDWRGCDLEGVRLAVRDMKGLIVTASQAAYFARLLGLKVWAEPPEPDSGVPL